MATKGKKSKAKRAKTVEFVTVTPPTGERLNVVRGEIQKSETKLGDLTHWEPAYASTQAKLDQLRAEATDLELQLMPLPALIDLPSKDAEPLIDSIKVTGNHRERFDEAGLHRLARAIRAQGVQNRIGLRGLGDGSYELICGARRLAASKLAGRTTIPAKVYPRDLTPTQVELIRTSENFDRKELTWVEKAMAVARTIDAIEETTAQAVDRIRAMAKVEIKTVDDAAKWQAAGSISEEPGVGAAASDLLRDIWKSGGLHAHVGQQLGYPERWIRDHAYVAQLGGEARELLASDRITIGHARELAKLGDKERADEIAISSAKDDHGLGGRSVDWLRARVVEAMRSLRGVPWRLEVAFGKGVKGCTGYACSTCPFNSKTTPDLFGGVIAEESDAGTCTNEACFKAKTAIAERDVPRAVAKMKAKVEAGKVEANETAAAAFVPIHIRAATVARKVKKEAAPAEAKTTPAASTSSTATTKRTPEEIAEAKLDGALEAWTTKTGDLVEAAILSDPAKFLAAAVMSFAPPFDVRTEINENDVAGASKLFNHAAKGELMQIATIAAAAQKKSIGWKRHIPLFDDYKTDALVQKLIEVWNLDAPAKPKLADFMPTPKAERPAARTAKESTAPVEGFLTKFPKKAGASLAAAAAPKIHVLSLAGKVIDHAGSGITAESLATAAAACQLEGPGGGDDLPRVGSVFEIAVDGYAVDEYAVIRSSDQGTQLKYVLQPLVSGLAAKLFTLDAVRAKQRGIADDDLELEGLRVDPGTATIRSFHKNSHQLVAIVPKVVRHSDPINTGRSEESGPVSTGPSQNGPPLLVGTFSEDATIHTTTDLGLKLEELERVDCLDSLEHAGEGFATDVPLIDIVTDKHGTDFAVVGRQQVRGRDCWRLLHLAKCSTPKRGQDAPPNAHRGNATADRARRGDFEFATVRVGKAWRLLVDGTGANAPVFVENAPPPRVKRKPAQK